MKIKELDMVTLTGTVVHIYKGGKICEVELDTPHLHTTKPVLMTCMMSMLSKVPSSHKNQKTKTKKGQ
jgi:hypothetical protein